ncbi:unnamed protein product [Clonostachys byssicola]|uniref:Uncharacterized protein n=1 Tax=Clonostachys byssicola TaxID=160290 RepID=A0A9N9UBX6_9HYPO|nr:unnamed protein product [Clonostachys byssicola]
MEALTPGDIGLIQLWPKSDIAVQTILDIVAIHGLGGHPIKTWRSGKSVWLRDFLPSAIPEARIFTFGYSSKTTFAKTVSEIGDFARELLERLLSVRRNLPDHYISQFRGLRILQRPLIFICHSLGGIIFKKSLCLAHDHESRYGSLLAQIKSVIFLGTPHRGSDIATWAKMLGKVSNLFIPDSVRIGLLNDLEPQSRVLKDIEDQFLQRTVGLRIFTFYERVKTKHIKSLVVESDSAILRLPNEVPLPLEADHRNICKFLTTSDPGYTLVLSCLEELVDQYVPKQFAPQNSSLVNYTKFLQELNPNNGAFDPLMKYHATPNAAPVTCDWVKQDATFLNWFEARTSSWLWVHGSPGSGKSVLVKYVIDLLRERPQKERAADVSDVVSYIFCDGKVTLDETAACLVLRSILSQIFQAQSGLIKHLGNQMDNVEIVKLTSQQLTSNISDVMLWASNTRFWLIIDAVDELPVTAAEDLLNSIWRISGNDISRRIHILISNRSGIASQFTHIANSLCLDSEKMHEIVQHYIEQKVTQFGQEHSIPLHLLPEIQAGITARSNTNFLIASLSWTAFYGGISLWSPSTVKARLLELDKLEFNLGHLYASLLANVPKDFRPVLKKIFMLLTVARRPLSINDIHFAVSITEEHRSYEQVQSNFGFNFERVLRRFSMPFLSVDSVGSVQFRHHSFREFLTQKRTDAMDEELIMQFRSSVLGCEYFANWVCFKVLTFMDWKKHSGEIVVFKRDQKGPNIGQDSQFLSADIPQLPLLLYAMENFNSHLEKVQEEPEVVQSAASFFTEENLQGFYQLYSKLELEFRNHGLRLQPDLEINYPPMHLLAQLGDFLEIFKTLDGDLNKIDRKGYTPLAWAVRKSRYQLMKFLLLNPRVDPNVGLAGRSKPLHLSIKDEKAFLLLISSPKVDINCKGMRDRTVLHSIISHGQLLVHLLPPLLEREDLDVNALDVDGVSPLISALGRGDGYQAAMQLLNRSLEEKLDVSTTDGNGTNALALASLQGWTEVRKILVSRDRSQMFTLGQDGMNMLTRAAYFGNQQELKELLSSVPRADVVRLSNEGRFNLMNLCAQQDWADTLEHLRINFGLESQEQDTRGRTVLHWAAFSGWSYAESNLSKVQQGLINVQDFDGSTPLHLGAEHRNLRAVEFLLKEGANLLIRDKHGRTPVHVAANSGAKAILELMLLSPIREFGRDKQGLSLLHYIATWEWPPVLTKFITEKRPIIDVRDRDRRTPLHYAAIYGNTMIGELLMDAGADIELRDCIGFTPVFHAVRQGHVAFAELLHSRRANLCRRDFFNRTTADIIGLDDDPEMIELLQELKAPFPVHRKRRYSPPRSQFPPTFTSPMADWAICLPTKEHATSEELKCPCCQETRCPGINRRLCENLQLTVLARHLKCIRSYFMKCSDAPFEIHQGRSAFHVAAYVGDELIVRELLSFDMSGHFDVKSSEGTPALIAASFGHFELANELILRGADPFQVTEKGFNMLHLAALGGYLPLVETLIAKGLSVETKVKNEDGLLALHMAVDQGEKEVVEFLLGFYTSRYRLDPYQSVALFLLGSGCFYIDPEQQLIGVNRIRFPKQSPKFFKTQYKEIASDLARSFRLLSNGGSPYPILALIIQRRRHLIQFDRLDLLSFLLKMSSGRYDQIVIHCVSAGLMPTDTSKLLQVPMEDHTLWHLVDHGVNPLIVFSDGSNILHHMLRLKYLWTTSKDSFNRSIKKLVSLGVDINGQNSEGDTPLLVLLSASVTNSEHYFSTVEAVMQSGADPRISRKDGTTALDLARKDFPWSYPAYRLIQNSIKAFDSK